MFVELVGVSGGRILVVPESIDFVGEDRDKEGSVTGSAIGLAMGKVVYVRETVGKVLELIEKFYDTEDDQDPWRVVTD